MYKQDSNEYTDSDYDDTDIGEEFTYPDVYPIDAQYYEILDDQNLLEYDGAIGFNLTIPGPGCITAITLLIGIILAVVLYYLVGTQPSSILQDESSLEQSVPLAPASVSEINSETETSNDNAPFTASSEAAVAPCVVSELFPQKVLRWCNLVSYYANRQSLNPDLIAALIWLESGGNEVAYSRSGAVGLMQIMPQDGLAAAFMCVNGPCFSDRPTITELQNPEFNIKYGTKMLARLMSKHGNLRDALKSYGPMNVGYYYADKVLGLFNQYGKTPLSETQ